MRTWRRFGYRELGQAVLASVPAVAHAVSGSGFVFAVSWCVVAMAAVGLTRPGVVAAGGALALVSLAVFPTGTVEVAVLAGVTVGVGLIAFAMARRLRERHDVARDATRAAEEAQAAHSETLRVERSREQRLRDVIDHLPDGVLVVGRRGEAQLANASAVRMLGTASPDALWSLRPEGATSWNGGVPFSEVIRTERAVRAFPAEVDTPSGRRELSADLVPLGRHDSPDAAVLVVLTDVTERRRSEQEMERTRRRLAHAERTSAVGSLTSGVFHEIRTPLTYIMNSLNLARFRLVRSLRGESDLVKAADDAVDHMGEALEGAARINRLVTELRQFTRPTETTRGAHGLARVLEEAVGLFRATHPGSVAVDARLDADPVCVVDRVEVQQVLLNLLENAQEAMGGRGTILVRLKQTTRAAEFSVQDDGPGIPRELQARVFDEFYTTKPSGTGLGLNIVRRIAEAHGGGVRVESPPGKGARFVVTLPLAAAVRAAPVLA